MELGKFVTSERKRRVRALFTTEARCKRHEQQITEAQPVAMRYFAEAMWGPETDENGQNKWRTFDELEGFRVTNGVTDGKDYFVAYPVALLDLSLDWQGYRPPMCRLYVEKNDDGTKVTGIGGHSGPIFNPVEVGSYLELQNRTIYHFNPIGNREAA